MCAEAQLREPPAHCGKKKAGAHAELLCGQAEGLPPVRFFDVDFRPVTQQKAATIAAVPDLRDRLGAGAEVAPETGARGPSGGQLSAHARSGSVQDHGGGGHLGPPCGHRCQPDPQVGQRICPGQRSAVEQSMPQMWGGRRRCTQGCAGCTLGSNCLDSASDVPQRLRQTLWRM